MVTRQETSQRSVLPRLAGAVVWPPGFCPASALCSKLPEYKIHEVYDNVFVTAFSWETQCLKFFFGRAWEAPTWFFTNWEIGTDCSARCCKSMKPSFCGVSIEPHWGGLGFFGCGRCVVWIPECKVTNFCNAQMSMPPTWGSIQMLLVFENG